MTILLSIVLIHTHKAFKYPTFYFRRKSLNDGKEIAFLTRSASRKRTRENLTVSRLLINARFNMHRTIRNLRTPSDRIIEPQDKSK